ncbi:MAG TPA: DapH/DapD/GlmU-related protein [Candidatus Methylacidiphilales bacterium]
MEHRYETGDAYASPWTARERAAMLLWGLAWPLLCAWTPKPLNPWRLLVARLFGARLSGTPFIHPRARIAVPWRLTMGDRACLGDRAHAYSLGEVVVEARATVAQEAYLCAGTHDFSKESLPLVTRTVRIGEGAFVGARAFVLPGVTVGARAVVGACAVVTKDVPPGAVVAGNPAHLLRPA